MDARIAHTLAELLRSMPADGPTRNLALRRLTRTWAEAEASAAVRAAAARSRESLRQRNAHGEALANAVSAASALRNLDAATAADQLGTVSEREQLALAIAEPAFIALLPEWIAELRGIASNRPGTGACTTATAMQLWLWTMSHVRRTSGAEHAAVAELAHAFARLIAVRAQILEVSTGSAAINPAARQFYTDLCHVEAARAAGEVAMVCAEIVFGYRSHPSWDAEGCAGCYHADDLDALEGFMPGIASSARAHSDVIEADGAHQVKAGPCAQAHGVEMFQRLRAKLDGCLTGARLAQERAAAALPGIAGEAATSSLG